MHVRLAFSVAIQVDADILLIDEVLAVGDAAFQQKCFDVFHRMRDEGKTIIFVTHDMGNLQRFCHRALLLERGALVHIGDPKEVADRYLEINFGRDPDALGDGAGHGGAGDARVIDVWVEDEEGRRVNAVPQGRRTTLRALVDFAVDVEDPSASIDIYNERHDLVFGASTVLARERSGIFRRGERVLFSFSFENLLADGRYSPVVNLARRGSGLDVIDRYDGGFSFMVTSTQPHTGLVNLPVDVSIERMGAAVAQAEVTA
jgi:ABC-2 type transport system ATP-binding protein